MKKIAFLCPLRLQLNGASNHILNVWGRLSNRSGKYDVTLLLFDSKKDPRLRNYPNLEVVDAPVTLLGRKIRFLSTFLYQLYVAHYLTFRNDVGLIYERYDTLNFGGMLASRMKNIPLVVEVNGFVPAENSKGVFIKVALILHKFLTKRLFGHASAIVCVSTSLAEQIQSYYLCDSRKIVVIENGVDIDELRPLNQESCRKRIRNFQTKPIIFFLGGMQDYQGLPNLIAAMPKVIKEIPTATLYLAGDGPQKQELIQEAQELGIEDHISFLGVIPLNERAYYINAADVCVSPYHDWYIGSPIKVLEYLACGRPTVVGLTPSTKLFSEVGVLLAEKAENTQLFSQALIKLLVDDELRRKMQEECRPFVEQNYSWERVVDETITRILSPLL